MHRRIFAVIRLAFAPVPSWQAWWQMVVFAGLTFGGPVAWLSQYQLPLKDAAEFSGIIAFVAVFVAAYRLQKRNDEIVDGAPKLIPLGVSQMDNVRIVNARTGEVVGVTTYYHLRIVNRPTGAVDRKTAERVTARVQICDLGGAPKGEERAHRWEHSPPPTLAGKAADHHLPTDIPPDSADYKLDLAMKYDEDAEFYIPTNYTVGRYADFRDETAKYGEGEYLAKIRLGGNNVCKEIKCRIFNPGKGKKLRFELLTA